LALQKLSVDDSLSERTSLSMESISKLLFFCVRSNFFKCDGVFYRTSTCPMGSPLSPALASIFMENFEDKVLESTNLQVLAWKRYVDDSFVAIAEGQEDILLTELNSQHEKIKFTCEKEKEGKLAFLDILVKRLPQGIDTTVYRKDSSTDRYLDFSSSHCDAVKWGLVSCLKKRAERVCKTEESRREELDFLRQVFRKNGFPAKSLNRRLSLSTSATRKVGEESGGEESVQNIRTLAIPYVPGVSDRLARAAKKMDLQVRFRKSASLGCLLSNNKLDRVPEIEKGGVVYRQECNECELVYIGETARKACIRKKEHEKDVREMNERSAIAEHCLTHNHKVDFNKFSVIKQERNWLRRRIKEGIEIFRHPTFNRDEGLHVDRKWKRFLL